MAKRDQTIGASKSLNKTISEIEAFINSGLATTSTGLREEMYKKIGDLCERWYRRGFNRGHRACREEYKNSGLVPRNLSQSRTRLLAPGQRRQVRLRSKA